MGAKNDIDQQTAESLGFPNPDYRGVELERRWLCREVPRNQIRQTETITDLYVSGSRLRLREARPADGSAAKLRLSRKADVNPQTRLITSIYLPEDEFALLAGLLKGIRLEKIRHRLHSPSGVMLAVDEFQGELSGLVLVEAEFESPELMASFPMPEFASREVTGDQRYTGGALVRGGVPRD